MDHIMVLLLFVFTFLIHIIRNKPTWITLLCDIVSRQQQQQSYLCPCSLQWTEEGRLCGWLYISMCHPLFLALYPCLSLSLPTRQTTEELQERSPSVFHSNICSWGLCGVEIHFYNSLILSHKDTHAKQSNAVAIEEGSFHMSHPDLSILQALLTWTHRTEWSGAADCFPSAPLMASTPKLNAFAQ